MKFVAGLVVVVGDVVLGLFFAPGEVVSTIFHAFADREGGNAHARKAEMV